MSIFWMKSSHCDLIVLVIVLLLCVIIVLVIMILLGFYCDYYCM